MHKIAIFIKLATLAKIDIFTLASIGRVIWNAISKLLGRTLDFYFSVNQNIINQLEMIHIFAGMATF